MRKLPTCAELDALRASDYSARRAAVLNLCDEVESSQSGDAHEALAYLLRSLDFCDLNYLLTDLEHAIARVSYYLRQRTQEDRG